MPVDERVVPALAGVRWNPGAPDAVLVVADSGLAVLAVRPYPDDGDPDCVVSYGLACGRRPWAPRTMRRNRVTGSISAA
jgi:hypothetical protein